MNFSKNLVLWIIIAVLLAALFNLFQSSTSQRAEKVYPYSDFLTEVEGGRVADVTMQGELDHRSFHRWTSRSAPIRRRTIP